MKFNPPFKSLNEKTFFIMEEKTMKKLSRIAALLAATALLLGAFGCSSGGGSGNSDDNSDDDDTELEDDYTGKTTTGSWNFVSQADTVEWVAAFKTNDIKTPSDGTRVLDKSGDISIESDALSADTDGLTLTILAEKAWSDAKQPNYSYAEPASGLRIKNPALKIADVKGKVKVTVEWACIEGKAANDRKLQLLKDGGTVVKEKNNDATGSTTTDMTTFEATVAAGEGTNLYIGGDNNVFIKSVKVEAASASDVVETPEDKTPSEEEEEDLSSIFTIDENGYLNLVADKYEYYLSQANLEATTGNNAWSAVSGSGLSWGDKKSIAPFNTSTTVLNMSEKGDRAITLKVKGVAAVRVYVQKESASDKNNRTYKVKINDANEQTGHNNVDYEDFTTNTTGEATIFIGEASGSIYPVGVILYKTAPAAE